MISKEQLDSWFTYHNPSNDPGVVSKYMRIRSAARQFAEIVLQNTPEGPDQSDAIRKIREAMMTSNAAIACGTKVAQG